MKTKLITTFFALTILLSSSIASHADNAKERLMLSFKAPGVVMLKFDNNSEKNFSRVYILDAQKNVVYSETVSNRAKIAKLYNIKNLPEGEYTFKIVNKETTVVKSIVYKKEQITASEPLKVEIKSADVAGKVNVTCKGVNNKIVNVSILNKFDEVLYEEQIDIKKDFSRLYDLSQINESSVIVKISSENNEITNEVSLKDGQLVASK